MGLRVCPHSMAPGFSWSDPRSGRNSNVIYDLRLAVTGPHVYVMVLFTQVSPIQWEGTI